MAIPRVGSRQQPAPAVHTPVPAFKSIPITVASCFAVLSPFPAYRIVRFRTKTFANNQLQTPDNAPITLRIARDHDLTTTGWAHERANARLRGEAKTSTTWRGSGERPPVSMLLPPAVVNEDQIQRRMYFEYHTRSKTTLSKKKKKKKSRPPPFRRGLPPRPTLQCSPRPFQDDRKHNICRGYQIR
jgi:hypothetical protein